jgi:ferric-dicitrate binding protein FerR (iron transport regulator)
MEPRERHEAAWNKVCLGRNEIARFPLDECMMNRLHRSLLSLTRRPEFRSDEAIAGACLGVAIAGIDTLLVIGAFLVLVRF